MRKKVPTFERLNRRRTIANVIKLAAYIILLTAMVVIATRNLT